MNADESSTDLDELALWDPGPDGPEFDADTIYGPGVKVWHLSFNETVDMHLLHAYDTQDQTAQFLGKIDEKVEICRSGDLEQLKQWIESMRISPTPLFNRPTSWKYVLDQPRALIAAYDNGHWHIIRYLIQELGMHICPSKTTNTDLPTVVVEKALESNSTDDLEKLFEFWRPDARSGWRPGGMTSLLNQPPLLSRVIRNETLVSWFLSKNANPNLGPHHHESPTPMIFAAREAPLPILKLLVQKGGYVKDTDLIAQAALGDSWGNEGRLEVIKYLQLKGSDVNALAASTWQSLPTRARQSQDHLEAFMHHNQGGQTALQIAKLSGNTVLVDYLLQNGADPSIKALKNTQILQDKSENRMNYPTGSLSY